MSFGGMFRKAWSGATEAGRVAASAIATGAKVVGNAAVTVAKLEARAGEAVTQAAAGAYTGVVRTTERVKTTASRFKSWMDVQAARVEKVVLGDEQAVRRAERKGQQKQQERARRAELAVKAAEAAGRSWTAAARETGRKDVGAVEAARDRLNAGAVRAGAAIQKIVAKAGERGAAVADAIDRNLNTTLKLAFAPVKPLLCLPCLAAAGSPAAIIDKYFASLTRDGAEALTTDSELARFLESKATRLAPVKDQKQYDGYKVLRGCQETKGAAREPGVLPRKCVKRPMPKLPKITFVNGINTRLKAEDGNSSGDGTICQAMQQVADTYCAEVVGIYNATEGMGADLEESKNMIAGAASDNPAVQALATDTLARLRQGEKVRLVAHSEGGLITQQALKTVKQKLVLDFKKNGAADPEAEALKLMRKISVDSFGTAVDGWPTGPDYRSFVNDYDLVPAAISGVQKNFPKKVWDDSAPVKPVYFKDAHENPLDAHALGDSYLARMAPYLKRSCPCE